MTKHKRTPKNRTTLQGFPVVDADDDIALVITKKDVTGSTKKDPGQCAAALAGRRELHTEVRVYLSRTYVKDKQHKRWIRFVTPQSMLREIVAFDRGAGFEPGEYNLKAPRGGQRLGYQRRGDTPTVTGQNRRPRHITTNVRAHAGHDMVKG